MTAKNPFEVPTEMRDLAGRSVEQARKAFETFIGAAHKSAALGEGASNPVQKGLSDMTRKTVGFAETNVKAAFQLAEQLVQAKTVEEVFSLQTEYIKAQASALQSQMAEAGEAVKQQFGEAAASVQAMGKKPKG
jgi:phasin